MPRSYDYDHEGGGGGGAGHASYSATPTFRGLGGVAGASDADLAKRVLGRERKDKDKEEEKPCRTCTDFKSWMRIKRDRDGDGDSEGDRARNRFVPTVEEVEAAERERMQCPVDKDELGSATWKLLHTVSVNYPDAPTDADKTAMSGFLSSFSHVYPCPPCAEDFRRDMAAHPPRLGSAGELARWMCEAHNRVNVKVGKEEFDCGRVFERWRDGWADNRCDDY